MASVQLKTPVCVDCLAEGITTVRKVATTRAGKPVPGKRCATHHRAKRFDRKSYSHEKHVKAVYGLSYEEYWAVHQHQGGRCALCQRATGAARKLAVDHDHATGMVRGELCTFDNRLLGHARDSIEFFERCIDYLKNPPAVQVIGVRIVPDHIEGAA